MKKLFRRLYRSPTLHFLLLGLAAFTLIGDRLKEPEVLVVDPGVVEQTVKEWERFQRGPVTEEQRAVIAERLARSAVLVQVAREAGLDRTAAVEQRLVKLARFLDLVGSDASDAEAARAARELGLHRTDPVVRRYLENAAEALIAAGVDGDSISGDAVETYYRRHPEKFTVPRRLSLSHVFISGEAGEADARAKQLAQRIERENLTLRDAIALGDVFYGGHSLGPKNHRQMAVAMGSAFADAVWQLPVGEWQAPVRSAYGVHIVRVESELPERQRPLADVRSEIVAELARERQQALVDQHVADLRQRYRIVGLADMEGST